MAGFLFLAGQSVRRTRDLKGKRRMKIHVLGFTCNTAGHTCQMGICLATREVASHAMIGASRLACLCLSKSMHF